jgi:Homeodomain-like domain
MAHRGTKNTTGTEQKLIAHLYEAQGRRKATIPSIAKAFGRSRNTVKRVVDAFGLGPDKPPGSRYKDDVTEKGRRCSKCRKMLPFTDFYFNKNRNYYRPDCRACFNAAIAARRKVR